MAIPKGMADSSKPFAALKQAINAAGSQSQFARLVGVTQPSVWKWLKRRKSLPAEHVLLVERELGVSRHDLRPDLYPIEDSSAVRTIPLAGAVGACDRPSGLQLGEAVR